MIEDNEHPLQIGLFDQRDIAEVIEGEKRYILCFNPYRKEEDENARIFNRTAAGEIFCAD
ncbi:MAG: hypothetical protein VB084_08455 [Syntrophomonadaceae bacterium]|nr:hypothetical protein [Syntrophomonadaceae bacterium]